MLPGKKYTPEDILLILKRRFWLLVVPPAVFGVITAAYASRLPNIYESLATIYVTPQQVPEAYVRSNSMRIQDRIDAIRQRILSRTRLEGLITELDLYREIRATSVMEDAVEQMRGEIGLYPRGETLVVSYFGREPRTVQKVADRVSDLVINESARDRENLTAGTDQFLESTLDEQRRRLADQEKRLANYRQAHRGELPSQQESNLQAIQNYQMQITQLTDRINNAQERRLSLEKKIQDLEGQAEQTSQMPATAAQATTAGELLAQGEQRLDVMLRTFKPDHPDVKVLKSQLAELRKRAEAEAIQTPLSAEMPVPVAERNRRAQLAMANDELTLLNKNIEKLFEEEKLARKASATYQERLAAAPTRETELIELSRDYNQVASTYSNFLTKREESKIAANLERRSLGAQFRLLDAARLPIRPVRPNRRIYNLGGLVIGLGLGLLVVALLEYRDRTFKTDDDVAAVVGLPVLAVVPLMQSEADQKRSRRRRWVLNIGFGSTVVVCMAAFAYVVMF